jgi:hypothetical protein
MSEIERDILERINNPGWVTTRGVLKDSSGSLPEDEHVEVEKIMRDLSERGLVVLWKLHITHEGISLLAAARPGYELDKELEQRGAWATAERA